MNPRVPLWFALVGITLLGGCSSITIVQPLNGSPNVVMPQPIEVKENGLVSLGDVFLDNINFSQVNGSHWQFVPNSTLYYVPPGQHTLYVSARDSKLNT